MFVWFWICLGEGGGWYGFGGNLLFWWATAEKRGDFGNCEVASRERVDTCSHKFMLKARGYCRILFSGTEHHKRT